MMITMNFVPPTMILLLNFPTINFVNLLSIPCWILVGINGKQWKIVFVHVLLHSMVIEINVQVKADILTPK